VRIFAYLAHVYFGQFYVNYYISPYFWATFIYDKSSALTLT
jgi:hypothetical protein